MAGPIKHPILFRRHQARKVRDQLPRRTDADGGIEFKRGIGLQSVSVIPLQLNRKGIRFHAVAGADEMGNKDIPIRFYVLGDGKLLFEGKPMRVGDAPETIDLDIRGIDQLGLLVKDDVGGVNNKELTATGQRPHSLCTMDMNRYLFQTKQKGNIDTTGVAKTEDTFT